MVARKVDSPAMKAMSPQLASDMAREVSSVRPETNANAATMGTAADACDQAVTGNVPYFRDERTARDDID